MTIRLHLSGLAKNIILNTMEPMNKILRRKRNGYQPTESLDNATTTAVKSLVSENTDRMLDPCLWSR
jgi:hypothetical protein